MEMAKNTAAVVQGMFQSTHHLHAKWHRIAAPLLPRSSHTLSVVNGHAYIFGGEVRPREPVDNDMHVIILPSGTVMEADYKTIPARSSRNADVDADAAVPEKRVGHTAAVIGERIFIFGGRGGKDMAPLEEKGRVWVFDTKTDLWSFLDPLPGTKYPSARSYHASVSFDKPGPIHPVEYRENPTTGEPIPGSIAANLKSEEEASYGTLFIHAGCPANGRTNDLWGFDIRSQTWKEFPSGPGKPRGGTALTTSKSRIYRYGGFNGESEEGGQVDFLELVLDTLADFSGEGQGGVALSPRRDRWETLQYESDENIAEQGKKGGNRRIPGNRSVAGFHTITTGMGREYLVLLLGERDPSSMGHDGAGKFWGDVWAFQVPPLGMSGASLKDATWEALGRETGEYLWSELYAADAEGKEGEDIKNLTPGERGWFASSTMGDLNVGGIVLWGGLNGRNEREGNGWILSIH